MSNLKYFTNIDKKKRKNSPILPDVGGSIDSFNHAIGSGDIVGTGRAMSENIKNDTINSRLIYDSILDQFKTSRSPMTGACYVLPDGTFLDSEGYHGNVDEFVISNFPEIDIEDYPNGYLVDAEQCIRLNDGKGGFFVFDRYITLPDTMTADQVYAIEDWLNVYPHDMIDVADSLTHNLVTYDLTSGITRLVNRIKKYKTSGILTEEDERQKYISCGLDPDIYRFPGPREDGTYYDDRGFHWSSSGHLIPEVTDDGINLLPKEWEEWWT